MCGTAGYYTGVTIRREAPHQRNGCHSPLAEIDGVLYHNGVVVGGVEPALDLASPRFPPVEGHLPDGLAAAHRQPGGESKDTVLGHVVGGAQEGMYSLESGQLDETGLDDEASDEAGAEG